MTDRFGLSAKTIQKIQAVLARYPQIEKAILYGSRAKCTCKTGSDIDLTLFGAEDLTTGVFYRISEEIDDLMLPYTFDLSVFGDIDDPDVIAHIERIGLVFYEKAMETATRTT